MPWLCLLFLCNIGRGSIGTLTQLVNPLINITVQHTRSPARFVISLPGPFQQGLIFIWNLAGLWKYLARPISMYRVAWEQQTARVLTGGKEHSMLGRIWRLIRHTVLRSMDVDSGTHLAGDIFPRCPVHNLLNREVGPSRLLLMKKRSRKKHLDGAGNIDQFRL